MCPNQDLQNIIKINLDNFKVIYNIQTAILKKSKRHFLSKADEFMIETGFYRMIRVYRAHPGF